MTEPTLRDLRIALAVAECGSFRAAGRRLDLAASTVSHAVRALERDIGLRLFHRTTRSVRLTPAGAAFLHDVEPSVAHLSRAFGARRDTAGITGQLRINTPYAAAVYLVEHVLPDFSARHPGIEIDLRQEDRMVDIVAEGCDAGIRLSSSAPQDMIGVPFGDTLRFITVASPDYLSAHGVPTHPSELESHTCLRLRMPRGERYHWEFEKAGETLKLDVPGVLTVDRMALAIAAAERGLGIAYVLEDAVSQAVKAGRLEIILSDWRPSEDTFMLFYPGRRHVPPPLRAFIDYLKQAGSPQS